MNQTLSPRLGVKWHLKKTKRRRGFRRCADESCSDCPWARHECLFLALLIVRCRLGRESHFRTNKKASLRRPFWVLLTKWEEGVSERRDTCSQPMLLYISAGPIPCPYSRAEKDARSRHGTTE